jgi:hypothetical protein
VTIATAGSARAEVLGVPAPGASSLLEVDRREGIGRRASAALRMSTSRIAACISVHIVLRALICPAADAAARADVRALAG